jgi:hypothetical protein
MEHRISVRDTKGNMKFIVGTLLAALRTARQEAPGEVYVLPLHAKAYHRRTLSGWTEDATAALYDHADRIPEIRAALESAK